MSEESLQWSHDLSAMDTWIGDARQMIVRTCFNGAMTFQPWILCIAVIATGRNLSGFNGAMTFQPWIRHRCGAAHRPQ